MAIMHETDLWNIVFSENDRSTWAESYCRIIDDDPNVRKYITSYLDVITYYLIMGDDDVIRENANISEAAQWYLENIKDDDSNICDDIRKLASN